MVLLTDDGLACWAACEHLDNAGGRLWRCTLFRNEGPMLSSDLVREGTERTFAYWRRRWRGLPSIPFTTEVDASKTRRKRDPGRCFLRAGWRRTGTSPKGLALFVAPMPSDWRSA